MNYNHKLFFAGFVTILVFSFSACTKYDPLFGVADVDKVDDISLTKDVAYIHDNDIYIANVILADQKKLTNTPLSTKTHISLSPKHDKVAYLDANGTPVIIDTSGTQLEYLSQYTNVTDLKWHRNSGNPTLIILHNNQIKFFGATLSIPSQPFAYAFPSDATFTAIDAIDINEAMDITFSFRYQKPYSPTSSLRRYYHGVGISYNPSSPYNPKFRESYDGYYSPGSSSYSSLVYPYYHAVRFNENDQNVTLGRITNGNEGDFSDYSIQAYFHLGNSTNSISSQASPLSSSTAMYIEQNEGYIASNPYQIRKYLYNIPAGVPPPTGSSNTWTMNFSNQNNNAPTYLDWQP